MTFMLRVLFLGACVVAAVWTLRGLLRDLVDGELQDLAQELQDADEEVLTNQDGAPTFAEGYRAGHREGLLSAAAAVDAVPGIE